MKSERELTTIDDISALTSILKESDAKEIVALRNELTDSWLKKQIFRTEVEMRVSVLNDSKHPTKASKYFQCVREQSSMFDNLMGMSFSLRRNEIHRLQLERKIESETDELKKLELQIDLDENLYSKAHLEQQAKDRVREIKLWSKLKAELDDGSFDTQNVEAHQMESLKLTLENKVRSLHPNSPSSEVINFTGPLKTLNRISNEKRLNENN